MFTNLQVAGSSNEMGTFGWRSRFTILKKEGEEKV